jgi:hypothetical protein
MLSRAGNALFGMVVLVLLAVTPVRDLLLSPPQLPAVFAELSFPLVTGAVLVLAAYSLFVPFRAYWNARRTTHVLTDRRVLQALCGAVEASASLDDIGASCHGGSEKGRGNVLFSQASALQCNALPGPRGFFAIGDAGSVYRSILMAKEERVRVKGGMVPDYLEFLLQGRLPDDLTDRDVQ